MDDETAPASVSDLKEALDRSLPEDMRQLADDARTLAAAEIAYQKARAAFAGNEAKRIAILGLFAAAFVFFTLMALIVGIVIALGPVLGPWGATATVAGGLALLILICAVIILWRVRRMKSVLKDEKTG